MACGNPFPVVFAPLSQLEQNTGGFLPGGRQSGVPELYLREVCFVFPIAVGMIEDNHPFDRVSFVLILR